MNIDLQDLLNLSEKVGSDPSLVQNVRRPSLIKTITPVD